MAASRHDRVHKHHGLAPVELFEHGGERQRALDKAGTSDADADEVFDKSTLSLELPSERMYELSGKPEPHGEEIDQSTDVMTVWAVFPNPHNILVPGLKVHVISHLADQTP